MIAFKYKKAFDSVLKIVWWLITAKTVALIIASQLHLFIPSANDKSSIDFTFNNQMIPSSTSAKYLGITINNRLSFKQHIIFLENSSAKIIVKVSYNLPLALYAFVTFTTRPTLHIVNMGIYLQNLFK